MINRLAPSVHLFGVHAVDRFGVRTALQCEPVIDDVVLLLRRQTAEILQKRGELIDVLTELGEKQHAHCVTSLRSY